jgi:hypothetical protein
VGLARSTLADSCCVRQLRCNDLTFGLLACIALSLQIAYSLLPHICSGLVFGPTTQVELHLLDIEPAKQALEGAYMLFNVDILCCEQRNAPPL